MSTPEQRLEEMAQVVTQMRQAIEEQGRTMVANAAAMHEVQARLQRSEEDRTNLIAMVARGQSTEGKRGESMVDTKGVGQPWQWTG